MKPTEWLAIPLGVGKGFARKYRQSNFLLLGGEGYGILVDCGFTAPFALDDLDLFGAVDAVLITHCHMDHVGGLEEFLIRRQLSGARPAVLIAPDEIGQQLNAIFGPSLRWVGRSGPFDVADNGFGRAAHLAWRHLSPYYGVLRTRFEHHGVEYEVVAFRTRHVPHMPCFGYKITRTIRDQTATVVISGDTALPVAEPSLVERADLIFHDVGDDPVHCSSQEVAVALRGTQAQVLGYHYPDNAADGPIPLAQQGHAYRVAARAGCERPSL